MLSEYEKNNISVKKLIISNINVPLLSEASLDSLCKMIMKSKLEKFKLTLYDNQHLSFHLHHSKQFLEAIKNCQIKEILIKTLGVNTREEDVDYLCSIIDSVKEGKNIESFELIEKSNVYGKRLIKKMTELAESRRVFDFFLSFFLELLVLVMLIIMKLMIS